MTLYKDELPNGTKVIFDPFLLADALKFAASKGCINADLTGKWRVSARFRGIKFQGEQLLVVTGESGQILGNVFTLEKFLKKDPEVYPPEETSSPEDN